MARRIRWQIVIASASALLVLGLMLRLALANTSLASPLAGGTYREAVLGAPVQVIPLLNDPLADPSGRDLSALLFDGLMRIGADGLPEPALAESYEVDSSGELYTFRLRRGVTWHDGQPFTANDVVFTLRALRDPNFNGDASLKALWDNVLVDRVDDETVTFRLRSAYAPFPVVARLPMLPAHLLEATPVEQWATSPYARQLVGTGPYILESLDTQQARLRANPNYFGGRPLIDTIELRFAVTPESALGSLTRGEVEAFGATADELGDPVLPQNLRRIDVPMDEYVVLLFNMRRPLLDDLPVRQALAHSLNKDELISQALANRVSRLDTPILPGWWAADEASRWYDYDPDTTSRILGEVGFTPGTDGVLSRAGERMAFSLITDGEANRLAAARDIARQLGQAGIQVNVEELSREELRQRLRDHDFDMALQGWSRLGPDPDNIYGLWRSNQADGGLNYAGLQDEQIDQLLSGARTETELTARGADYAAFQQRWIELAPSIVLYQPLYSFVFDAQLGGLNFDAEASSTLTPLLVGREDRYRTVMRWFVNSSVEIRSNLRQ
ncbi:MAG: peptide ABC transporter substrate-binding protein [Chloroflexaceae bacterium]|jgi:peptide/nickel transport system substrate-binding protein|nr:peptide ABC transporter substrate-binding protein [Chloroflexaceae bacterium]